MEDGRTVVVSCLASGVVSSVRSIGCSPVSESLFREAYSGARVSSPSSGVEGVEVGWRCCLRFLLRLSGSV